MVHYVGVTALALALGLTASACGSAPLSPEAYLESPRAGALAELRTALTRRAPLASLSDSLAARRVDPADVALLARLDEAFGDDAGAATRWRALLDDPTWGRWANRRLLALVDRAPLDTEALARASSVPSAAELTEAIALRLGAPDTLALARQRLGARFTYRVTGRLLSYPGKTASQPVRSGFGAPREVSAGFIASPEEGPGLYAFELELPPSPSDLALSIDTESAWVAHLDDAPRPLAAHPALDLPLPTRQRLVLPASPAPRRLQLLVTTRAPSALARVLGDPSDAAPVLQPEPGLAATLAAFDDAVARTDLDGVADALDALPPGPLRDLLTAQATLADPSLPQDLRRERARAALTRALGDATAASAPPAPTRGEPQLTEARALLAALALEDQALDDAQDALGPYLIPQPLIPRSPAALPPAALVDLLAELDPLASRALAARRLDALPNSCSAFEAWLDTHWEDLRYRDALARRLAAPTFSLAPLPGPCLDTRLRALDLLAETSAITPDSPAVAALQSMDPGPARARAHLLVSRLELARGHWQEALDAALRALADGGVDALARELSARAERLLGRLGPEPLHPGLPLRDPVPLIASFLGRAPRARLTDSDAQHGVEVLWHDRHLLVQADGSIVERLHRLVRVNDVTAVESLGELPLPDDAEVLVARTWKPRPASRTLSVTPLEPEEILEKSTISLPALSPGDFAEWAWIHTIPADPRLAPGWRAPAHAFDDADGPTTASRFTLTLAPGARPPTFSFEPRLAAPTRPDPTTWVFVADHLSRVLGEPLDPRPEARRLTVRASSGLDPLRWGDALAAELAAQTRPSPVLAEHLAQATASLPEVPTPEATLRALYDYTRRTIDEPPDVGPLSGDASFIGARRRGSRLTFLLGLCRQAGLACEPVLARPLWEGRDGRDPDPDALSYGLLRGPLGSDGLARAWLDPTGRWMPYGLLPPALEGVSALALPATSSWSPPPSEPAEPTWPTQPGAQPSLIVTPSLPPARWGLRKVSIHLAIKNDGKAVIATGAETLDGLFASSWRTALTGMTVQARTKILGAIVLQALPSATVEAVTLDGLDDDTVPLTWSWRAALSTQPGADTSGRGSRTRTLALTLFSEGLARGTVVLPTRDTPLLVNRAARMELTLTVDAAPGWGFPSGPADLAVRWPQRGAPQAPAAPTSEYAIATLDRQTSFENGGRTVVVKKRFELRPAIIEPSEYTGWSAAAQAIDRADVLQLVLAPAAPSSLGVTP